jgi:hypothetical protein
MEKGEISDCSHFLDVSRPFWGLAVLAAKNRVPIQTVYPRIECMVSPFQGGKKHRIRKDALEILRLYGTKGHNTMILLLCVSGGGIDVVLQWSNFAPPVGQDHVEDLP